VAETRRTKVAIGGVSRPTPYWEVVYVEKHKGWSKSIHCRVVPYPESMSSVRCSDLAKLESCRGEKAVLMLNFVPPTRDTLHFH
ncbi:hypothetical protein Tco_1396578, partial [Tanacetum coccineum]